MLKHGGNHSRVVLFTLLRPGRSHSVVSPLRNTVALPDAPRQRPPKSLFDFRRQIPQAAGVNTRIRIAVILLGALALGVLAWRAVHPPGLSYQGRPLIAWLHQFNEADDLAARREAGEAVQHIGTNGIPILLGMIALKEAPSKLREVPWLERQQMLKLPFLLPDEERHLAVSGFELLGPQAHAAVPALVQLAASTNLNVRNLALRSLAFAEPDPEKLRAALVKLEQSPDSGIRTSVLSFLRTFETGPAATNSPAQIESAPVR
jgi:hypothetical protein